MTKKQKKFMEAIAMAYDYAMHANLLTDRGSGLDWWLPDRIKRCAISMPQQTACRQSLRTYGQYFQEKSGIKMPTMVEIMALHDNGSRIECRNLLYELADG